MWKQTNPLLIRFTFTNDLCLKLNEERLKTIKREKDEEKNQQHQLKARRHFDPLNQQNCKIKN